MVYVSDLVSIPTRQIALLVATSLCAMPSISDAAGFAISEQSAKQLGMAFAGSGAVAEDGSSIWFNPAAMTRLESGVQASVHQIAPSFVFTDRGSMQVTPVGTSPLLPAGKHSNDGGESAVVPNFYYVQQLSERLHFGVALNSPFGLTTDYDANWIGRYQAIKSEIVSLNLNPAFAIRVNEHLSVGAGVSINYIDAELTNAIDFAAICASLVGGACPNGAVPGQGEFDGFASNEAEDTSFGANVGVLWSPSTQTRIAFSYRSQINHSLDGRAAFTGPAGGGGLVALGPLGDAISTAFSDGGITASVSLPDTASIGFYHRFPGKVALAGDVTWTDWADIPELKIVFENPQTPTATERLDWTETWRASLGAIVELTPQWTFRTGIAFDESPTQNATARTSRLPDEDRRWVAIGATRRLNERFSIDFGYAHLFIDTTGIARRGQSGNVLLGEFDSDADIFSFQVNYDFD